MTTDVVRTLDGVESGEVDAALWASALQGDARAVAVLFDRHHAMVFRAMRVRGASADEAEEAMAVAFLELWRRRAAVRLVAGSVRPWLLVTAHNAHRNRIRTALRYRAALQRLRPIEEGVDASEIAERRIAGTTRSAALRAALRRMAPADAALLALVDLDGVDQAQVATLLGIPAGTARVRLHRARGRLRADLLQAEPLLFGDGEIR